MHCRDGIDIKVRRAMERIEDARHLPAETGKRLRQCAPLPFDVTPVISDRRSGVNQKRTSIALRRCKDACCSAGHAVHRSTGRSAEEVLHCEGREAVAVMAKETSFGTESERAYARVQ